MTTLVRHDNTMWIDYMGAEPFYVTVLEDVYGGRILVTPETIRDMARGMLVSGPLSESENVEHAIHILSLPVVNGYVDVTDVGGGYDRWVMDCLPEDE